MMTRWQIDCELCELVRLGHKTLMLKIMWDEFKKKKFAALDNADARRVIELTQEAIKCKK